VQLLSILGTKIIGTIHNELVFNHAVIRFLVNGIIYLTMLSLSQEKIKNHDLNSISKDAYAICFVENQTPDICIAAVQKNGMVLRFIKDRSPEICLAAVNQNHFVRRVQFLLHILDLNTHHLCSNALWVPIDDNFE